MPDTTRTFIAVRIPDTLTTRLSRLQQRLAGDLPGVRWSTAPPYHVTLVFLGDVANADLNTLCKTAAAEAATFKPFDLTLTGLGVFPDPSRPRVVWAGVGGSGLEALKSLQRALAAASARLNYAGDDKPFHPHVTLGRAQSPRGRRPAPAVSPAQGRPLEHVLSHYRTWHAGPFAVKEAVVFASTLTRDGPEYAPLARAPLLGAKSGGSLDADSGRAVS